MSFKDALRVLFAESWDQEAYVLPQHKPKPKPSKAQGMIGLIMNLTNKLSDLSAKVEEVGKNALFGKLANEKLKALEATIKKLEDRLKETEEVLEKLITQKRRRWL